MENSDSNPCAPTKRISHNQCRLLRTFVWDLEGHDKAPLYETRGDPPRRVLCRHVLPSAIQ
jgi:hypothetical protein